MKGISLFSGGLDSILATRILSSQGIPLEALHFKLVFLSDKNRKESEPDIREIEKTLGVPLHTIDVSAEFLEIVKNPQHGYGKNMNPCIDCKIFMLRKAKEYMDQVGASFLVTGEVLGERPMSQRRDTLFLIEKKAGLKGLILRPLSAKLLPPTLSEQEGWVDRERLLDIQGRSRKRQIQLAADFGIQDYPAPAGGCLLTDPGFAKRLKDLMTRRPGFDLEDVRLLKVGRHFELAPGVKLVVGRDEGENLKLENLSRPEDLLLKTAHYPGPLSLLRGTYGPGEIERAGAITARYCKAKQMREIEVTCRRGSDGTKQFLKVSPASEEELKSWTSRE